MGDQKIVDARNDHHHPCGHRCGCPQPSLSWCVACDVGAAESPETANVVARMRFAAGRQPSRPSVTFRAQMTVERPWTPIEFDLTAAPMLGEPQTYLTVHIREEERGQRVDPELHALVAALTGQSGARRYVRVTVEPFDG